MTKAPSLFFPATFLLLFLAIFYFTVTNMAGIYIVSDLGGSSEISVYAMVFYGLGNALCIPLSKYLIDRFGVYKQLMLFLILYILTSFFCCMSFTFPLFIIFRLLQGFSAGPFFLLVKKMIDLYAEPEKKKSLNSFSILLYSLVPVIGACYGAFIAYEFKWSWIFLSNQPFAFFLLIYFYFAFKTLPKSPSKELPFNFLTYFFYCLALLCLTTALTLAQQIDWFASSVFIFLLFTGVLSLIFFVYGELYQKNPIFHLRHLKELRLLYCLGNAAILFASYFGMIILIALWLKIYVNYTPTWIAAILGTMIVAGTIGYLIESRYIDKIDPRYGLATGMIFLILSCTYSSHFSADVDFFHLAVARSLAGFGFVFFTVPLIYLTLSPYKEEKSYEVFVQFHSIRTLFSSLGAGLYVILWQRRQIFFHERLGEKITNTSLLTKEYFQRATSDFHLTTSQAQEELGVLLNKNATSLGLNDTFGFMGLLLGTLFVLLMATFLIKKIKLKISF